MTSAISLVVYPVKDLAQAKKLYSTLLGIEPYADAAYYVGFRLGDQEIGLDPHGHDKGIAGPICYFNVADVTATLETLLHAGAELLQAVQDVGGGKLMALVKDVDGSPIGLLQAP